MELDQNAMDLWYHYEEIAMHFNQLMIQYRLQLMAGMGALGGILVFSIENNVKDRRTKINLRAFASSGLLLILAGAICLDLYYYYPLLEGAVEALVALEQQLPSIDMSTRIVSQFEGDPISIIRLSYGLIFIPLLAITVVFVIQAIHYKLKSK